jgi:hypothetical protein
MVSKPETELFQTPKIKPFFVKYLCDTALEKVAHPLKMA